MTSIVVVVTKTQAPLPAGITFAGTSIAVTDNSGAKLPTVLLNGTESPAWQATFTGTAGPNEAVAVIQDLDTNGNAIGSPITVTETGTGGQPQNFAQSTAGSITVT